MKDIKSKKCITCERCGIIIGKHEIENKSGTKLVPIIKSIFFDNATICPHCGAEFCKDCYSKMNKCYCCGKLIIS